MSNCKSGKSILRNIRTYMVMIFVILLFFGNNSANCIKFFFKMTPHSNKCLGDYLTSNTVGKNIYDKSKINL